jgi:DNA helicase-2/ATP-dependent DNA helicase PcrA
MADGMKNCFLVNAPAGSGKTTQIKTMINNVIINNPKDNILCITYTNRAADELSRDIKSQNVFIGTIHSFLYAFMKQYFNHKDVLNLYFATFKDAIQKRIANVDNDEHISGSNDKYVQKYGQIDYETVKKNISVIFYNESQFSSLYYGGLSHDDLIRFSKCVFDEFPSIMRRINAKYQYIFIDEYQDTTANVLEIFYNSISKSNSKLYLFGDKMQQIYRNYDGSFEDQFTLFNTSVALRTNYRSVPEIVELLNCIYNDDEFKQKSDENSKQKPCDFMPRVIICDSVESKISQLTTDNSDTLVLYLLNKQRFVDIGAKNLYQAFSKMDKYSFEKRYSPVDVLICEYRDNPDPLMQLLYLLVDMYYDFKKKLYGVIIQKAKSYKSIFSQANWHISTHSDKQVLYDDLYRLFSFLTDNKKNIGDFLEKLRTTALVVDSYVEEISNDDEYSLALDVPISEVIAIYDYMKDPKISTQHGVKGESHDSVIFVADDSRSNPVVHMYRFFEMWGELDISLNTFQQFYFAYSKALYSLQNAIGYKINDLKKDTYTAPMEATLTKEAEHLCQQYKGDSLFEFLCANKYESFLDERGVTKAREAFKENTVYGVLSAYKLFYVGCSRARRNLSILVDREKIKGNIELQVKKFKQLGFDVIEE